MDPQTLATVHLLEWGVPIAFIISIVVASTRRRWRQLPKSEAQLRLQVAWKGAPILPQFGVRVGFEHDPFLYDNLTGKRLGPLAGAKASLDPDQVPPSFMRGGRSIQLPGRAVITFADGGVHSNLFAMRNMAEARAQLARFNAVTGAVAMPAGQWARTKPADLRS